MDKMDKIGKFQNSIKFGFVLILNFSVWGREQPDIFEASNLRYISIEIKIKVPFLQMIAI